MQKDNKAAKLLILLPACYLLFRIEICFNVNVVGFLFVFFFKARLNISVAVE